MNVSNKVIASTVAGAATSVLVWALSQFGHIEVPGEIAAAITTLLSAGAGYFTPHGGDRGEASNP